MVRVTKATTWWRALSMCTFFQEWINERLFCEAEFNYFCQPVVMSNSQGVLLFNFSVHGEWRLSDVLILLFFPLWSQVNVAIHSNQTLITLIWLEALVGETAFSWFNSLGCVFVFVVTLHSLYNINVSHYYWKLLPFVGRVGSGARLFYRS